MEKWIYDANGNRCSIDFWGSEEAAQMALDRCTNCNNCNNCTYCNNCNNCTYCTYCTNCINCTYCSHCNHCTNCNSCNYCNHCTNCTTKGPTRSDGYTFYFNSDNQLRAGCRCFDTFREARAHWNTRYVGTNLWLETQMILDYMEKIQPEGMAQ